MGTGSICALAPPRYLYNGKPAELAAALDKARLTPNMEFAPNLDLLSVPSGIKGDYVYMKDQMKVGYRYMNKYYYFNFISE